MKYSISYFVAVLSVTKDTDSGLGQSSPDTSDVLVFGTDLDLPDLNKSKLACILYFR